MKNGFLIAFLISVFSINANAKLRPVITLSAGTDSVHLTSNQNVTMISPYYNTYNGSNTFVDFTDGAFAGFEEQISNYFLAQLGLSYYQNTDYQARGYVLQFGDPTFTNFKYQYNILSKRFFVESKLLTLVEKFYHPFINIGVGEAINRVSQYTETPISSADVPMTPGFGDRTTHSFAYFIGLGVDMDITQHIRLGALYRYVDLGNAKLNTTPLSDTGQTLSSNRLRANEVLIQLSYLG